MRYILLFIIIYLLTRFLFSFRQVSKIFSRPFKTTLDTNSTASASGPVVDQMKACPQCGTYNPTKIAYAKKGLYFCNKQCHKKYTS